MSRSRPRVTGERIRPRSAGDPNQEFLTIREAAANFHVSTRTVRRWIEDGEIPAYRVGRIVRIARSDLEAFLARHRVD
jgi:excisionase family DNA binding protein